MSTQAVITYTAKLLGLTAAATLETEFESVVLPFQYLYSIGVYPVSDVTASAGGNVTRTITLSLVPGTPPTATAVVNNATGQLAACNVTGQGNEVVASPIVQIPGVTDAIVGAPLSCTSVAIVAAGSGYSDETVIQPVSPSGQLGPTTAQTFTPEIGGGGALALVFITGALATGNYVYAPVLEVIDPTGAGSGAVLGVPDMILSTAVASSLPIIYPGGYDPTLGTPAVTFTPRFKYTWPDSIGTLAQVAPFVHLLRSQLQLQCSCPVAETVVVS